MPPGTPPAHTSDAHLRFSPPIRAGVFFVADLFWLHTEGLYPLGLDGVASAVLGSPAGANATDTSAPPAPSSAELLSQLSRSQMATSALVAVGATLKLLTLLLCARLVCFSPADWLGRGANSPLGLLRIGSLSVCRRPGRLPPAACHARPRKTHEDTRRTDRRECTRATPDATRATPDAIRTTPEPSSRALGRCRRG
jgi:hypothetical protein